MMNYKLFIDTWGLISLYNDKEPYHKPTAEYFDSCINQHYDLFTTNLVISEFITFRYNHFGHERSKDIINNLFESIESNLILLIEIDYKRMKSALELRYKYQDKPKISFTDLSSMVIMKEFDIKEVLTMDNHFEQANMGFELKSVLERSLKS